MPRIIRHPRSHTQVVRKRRRLKSAREKQEYPCWGWLRFGGSSSSSSSAATTYQPLRETDGYEGLIGNTPMVQLQSLSAATDCEILAKVCLWSGVCQAQQGLGW